MTADQFRSRPMVTRVLEPCPVCNTLAAEVKPRQFTVNWWSKKTRISCAACVPVLEKEYDETVIG